MDFLTHPTLTQILIIAFLVLLFFGSKKLAEFARGLGESTKELKKAGQDLHRKTPDSKDE